MKTIFILVYGASSIFIYQIIVPVKLYNNPLLQWKLDLRKPDLRKNLDLRKIVAKYK